MTETLRTFIAIPLPDPVIRMAGDVQDTLRARGVRLKWVRPGSMHLTLQFLGDVDSERIPDIEVALAAAVQGGRPFSLCARRIGVFPNLRRPRVVWIGVEGRTDSLVALQKKLGAALAPIGFPPEKRPFKGHLTLGRIKGRIDTEGLRQAMNAAHAESEPFTVDTVCLFKSDLRPSGAVYTRMVEKRLRV